MRTSSLENYPGVTLREARERSVDVSERMVVRERRVRSLETGSGNEGKYKSHFEMSCAKESSAGAADMCLNRNLTASTPCYTMVNPIGIIKLYIR